MLMQMLAAGGIEPLTDGGASPTRTTRAATWNTNQRPASPGTPRGSPPPAARSLSSRCPFYLTCPKASLTGS